MKATGIVRRIDDLGRIVIPKEIRRTMRIREGDPLEIYTDREGEVIFKKYSPIGEMNEFAAKYADALHKTCDLSVAITDRDSIIACAGIPKREYQDKTRYEPSEFRDCIQIWGSKNVAVSNLFCRSSGGDGVEVTLSDGVLLEDLVCEDNHRQGSSKKILNISAGAGNATISRSYC